MSWLYLARALFAVMFAQTQSLGGGASCCSDLTPRIRYANLEGRMGQGQSEEQWIQAIVLWRRADAWPQGYSAEAYRDKELAEFNAKRAAEALGRQVIGGVVGARYSAMSYTDNHRTLWVEGKEFAVPGRDSTLVVMVDRIDGVGGPPVVAGTAYVLAKLPDEYWPKTWQSGDTTFHIRGRNTQGKLLAALRTSSVVDAFIK